MSETLSRYAGMSVLIIDDNPDNVALFRAVLEHEGLTRVYGETDSRLAASRLAECNPDLVLLDLHMPNLDGHDVLEHIQEFARGSYLPVLVVTADTSHMARNKALAQGAQDYLTKPIDTFEAVLRVANLLRTRQLYALLRNASTSESVELSTSASREDIKDRVWQVLRDHRITPVYQRIVDLNTDEIVGYEGLSRFTGLPQSPDRWFRDAFCVDLGVQLEWLAANTMLPFADTLSDGQFLAINMSPATVIHMKDHPLCSDALSSRIVIELTEHVPIEDYSALHDAMAQMRSHGARLAADDLGSGYAGFRHLVSVAPEIIKLDISLVGGIHKNKAQRALASALVSFANEVGAQVVAEGVEEAAELAVVRDIGVPWAQGYYFGKPEPANPQAGAHPPR